MDVLNNEVLNMLIQERKGTCLSIFIPTHRHWNELNQDMLRFKNIVKESERILVEGRKGREEIDKILQPLARLIDDREFWNHQQDGLVIYAAENEFYKLRLPFTFREKIYVSNRFFTKNLLPVFNGDKEFFILSVDVHKIRLFRGYHYGVREINLEKTPVNIDEALGLGTDTEKKMQYRAEISTGNSQRASFHGQGARNDATMRKRDILRFFEMVNDGLIHILKHENAPLILAGVEYAIPLYREANEYPNLCPEYLKVDTEITKGGDLYDRGRALLEPYFNQSVLKDLNKYGDLASSERTSDKVQDIIKAAYENRVAVLFVNTDDEIWGKFDTDNYDIVIHNKKEEGDVDLLDFAATQTILHNGTIYTLNRERMPNGRSAAAIYRF